MPLFVIIKSSRAGTWLSTSPYLFQQEKSWPAEYAFLTLTWDFHSLHLTFFYPCGISMIHYWQRKQPQTWAMSAHRASQCTFICNGWMNPRKSWIWIQSRSVGLWGDLLQMRVQSRSRLSVHQLSHFTSPLTRNSHHKVTKYGEKTSWKENVILKNQSSRLCPPQQAGLGSETAHRVNWRSACAGSNLLLDSLFCTVLPLQLLQLPPFCLMQSFCLPVFKSEVWICSHLLCLNTSLMPSGVFVDPLRWSWGKKKKK